MIRTCATTLGLFVVTGLAQAVGSPLNLVIPAIPNRTDVNGGSPAITYNAGSDLLTISGASSQVIVFGSSTSTTIAAPIDGTWTISAIINASGNPAGPASLSISGKYPGPTSQLLFSGTVLSGFGWNFLGGAGGSQFEFLFQGNGGTLNPFNITVGAIVRDTSLSQLNWNSDFTNDPFGFGFGFDSTADAFLVPAPSTMVLALAGLGLTTRRRRS